MTDRPPRDGRLFLLAPYLSRTEVLRLCTRFIRHYQRARRFRAAIHTVHRRAAADREEEEGVRFEERLQCLKVTLVLNRKHNH